MKYYIRLVKNKAYDLLIFMLVIALFGVFVTTIPFNAHFFNEAEVHSYGATIIFKIIIFLLGLLVIHTALVAIPVSSKVAQDLSEFKVKSDKAYIYIEFRKYKWKIKREMFVSSGAFSFFDENRNFITWTRANQVYNAVVNTKETKLVEQCAEKDKISLIPDARVLTPQEKNVFCAKLKLNRNHWALKFISMFCFLVGLMMFTMPFQVIDKTWGNIMVGLILGIVLGTLFIMAGCTYFKLSCEGKKEYKYLKNQDVYRVKVYVYDRKVSSSQHSNRYVKISDGEELFFEELYKVTNKQFENAAILEWYAYYYKERDGCYKIRVMAYYGGKNYE